jgi:hypothetical protein
MFLVLKLGNYIDRNTYLSNKTTMMDRMQEKVKMEKEDCSPSYLQAYFQEMDELIAKYTPAMVGDQVLKELKTTNSWKSSFNLASNLLNARTSTLANHVDARSVLPAVMTCCNPMGTTKPWIHGELLYTQGAFLIKYTLGDVVLMFGDSYHAVLPIIPHQGTKAPVRSSIVHFSRWGSHIGQKKKRQEFKGDRKRKRA